MAHLVVLLESLAHRAAFAAGINLDSYLHVVFFLSPVHSTINSEMGPERRRKMRVPHAICGPVQPISMRNCLLIVMPS